LNSVAKRPGKFSSFEQFLGFGGAGGVLGFRIGVLLLEEERDIVFSFCLVVFLQLLSFWELWILDEYCGGKIQQESFF
jgi:hypothetical protein